MTDVFQEVSPSIVRIISVTINPFAAEDRVQTGIGTGVVYDSAGHIVTNAHVVYGAQTLLVSVDDENIHEAAIVGTDPVSDLAVIRIVNADVNLRKIPFADSRSIVVGQGVLAVGYPLGIGKTASQGIVSGLNRLLPISAMSWLTPMIQTDAAINPGNSGGPLIDLCGRIIGINTSVAVDVENIGFAVPSDVVKEIVPELVSRGHMVRPWHGINGKIVPAVFLAFLHIPPGVLVETIEPGSPAEKIGLRGGSLPVTIGNEQFLVGGDVITFVNGVRPETMSDLARIVRSFKVGDTVTITYWRDGQENAAEVVLPERPVLTGDLVAIGRAGTQPRRK